MSDDENENKTQNSPPSAPTMPLPGSSNQNPEGEIQVVNASRITVKAPPFWRANPALWFCQLEAQFDLNRITSDRSKYNTVVAAIESSILHQVSDLVLNPPLTGLYNALKQRLLDVFAESEQSRLKKLLGEIELAEQKPTTLLREMRSLAGDSITADLLKTLWLQRLPCNIQAILSISSEGIESLAIMADKIFETSSRPTDGGSFSRSSDYQNQISALSRQIAEMKTHLSRRDHANNHSRSRSKTPRPKTKTDDQSDTDSKVCWYHNRWGDKATSCIGKCNFKSKNKSLN